MKFKRFDLKQGYYTFATVLIVLLFFPFMNCLGQSKSPGYINPTPGRISIMACSPVSEGMTPTHSSYKDVVDCGFNLMTQMASADFFKAQFKLIGDLDLKCIVSNPLLRTSEYVWLVDALKDSPYLAGWLLMDEPSFDYLNELREHYFDLYNRDPDHLILINLVGVLQKTYAGNIKSLSSYYNYIQNLFQPSVWSYDFYPIIKENGKINVKYDDFYNDLEIFSKLSQKTQRPFWAFCESMEYKTNWYSRPAATEAYLSFEAFSALAYGAQGIVYWTYGMRKSNDIETYLSALIDSQGNKLPAWYAARKVNRAIQKYNDVFYECKVLQVRHTGTKIYRGTKRLSGRFGPLKMIRNEDSGVLVSLIENGGKTYVVIVNHDVLNPQNITLELSPNKKVKDITSFSANIYNWREDINVTLEKGGFIILQEIN